MEFFFTYYRLHTSDYEFHFLFLFIFFLTFYENHAVWACFVLAFERDQFTRNFQCKLDPTIKTLQHKKRFSQLLSFVKFILIISILLDFFFFFLLGFSRSCLLAMALISTGVYFCCESISNKPFLFKVTLQTQPPLFTWTYIIYFFFFSRLCSLS